MAEDTEAMETVLGYKDIIVVLGNTTPLVEYLLNVDEPVVFCTMHPQSNSIVPVHLLQITT